MKKLIALLLALTCIFSFVGCGDDTCETHVDDDYDTFCDVCGHAVPHTVCIDNNPKDAKCDYCGKAVPCFVCTDADKNAECDICGKTVPCDVHTDANKDAICDVCSDSIPCAECVDDNKDGKCDVCKKDYVCRNHVDASPKNGMCDICGFDIPCAECVDSNYDTACDVCGKRVACVSHIDIAPKNGACDVCGERVDCAAHSDDDSNARCDICGVFVPCTTCVDASPRDTKCDVCGRYVACTSHNDTAPADQRCDTCGVYVACVSHVDANKDARCDVCDSYVPCQTHEDYDRNARCDVCGKIVTCVTHADADYNNICDACGADFTPCDTCVDANKDGACDVCAREYQTEFQKAISDTVRCYSNSIPTKIVTNSTRIIGSNAYTLSGKYVLVTGKVGGKIATVYTSEEEKLRSVADGSNEDILDPIFVETHYKQFLQGKGLTTDGKNQPNGLNFAPTSGSDIALDISIDKIKNISYRKAEFNNTLTFVVPKANIKAIFGTTSDGKAAIDADSDVRVQIYNNGAQITGIMISYSVKADGDFPAETVRLETTYSYDLQEVTLVD